MPADTSASTDTSVTAHVPAVPRLFVSDYPFEDADRARLRDTLGAALLTVASNSALREALRAHPETDVLCTFRPPSDLQDIAPGLRWLALPSAGAEGVVRAGLVRPGGPIVTSANGVHGIPISEYVFSALLAWTRHWPEMLAAQQATTWPDHARWQQLAGRELHDATLFVIGLGAIGRDIARLGRAFGMRTIATRRSAAPGASDPDVDLLLQASRLHDGLAQSDFIVVAAPATAGTHHLLGAAEFQATKRGAFLVNIARGELIDEAALIAALHEGTLGGAALDVFEQEPLPPTSPLWTMPSVLISPHVAGNTSRYSQRLTDLLLDNIARYRAGQPLRNTIDAERGY